MIFLVLMIFISLFFKYRVCVMLLSVISSTILQSTVVFILISQEHVRSCKLCFLIGWNDLSTIWSICNFFHCPLLMFSHQDTFFHCQFIDTCDLLTYSCHWAVLITVCYFVLLRSDAGYGHTEEHQHQHIWTVSVHGIKRHRKEHLCPQPAGRGT